MNFRLPHPAMFVLQKMLCRETRRADKQAKDLAYVFDVVTLFASRWGEMGEVAREVASGSSAHAAWIDRATGMLAELFASRIADGPISVRQVYEETGFPGVPSEEGVFQVINRFLEESELRRLRK